MLRKLTFILLLIYLFSPLTSQVISQWRGTDRKGIYPGNDLLEKWPLAGPQLLWSYDGVGNGYGSPSITSDRIYITGEKDSVEYLFALNHEGHLLWKVPCGDEWMRSYPGSRSAPTVTDDCIYVCTGLGNLCCFDARNGDRKWSVNLVKDLHGSFTLHGHAESPLVDGDKVFLTPGGRDTNVVALDRHSGKLLWVCKGRGERPGYNSPILISLPDRKIVVTFSAYAIMGIDADTGELLWWQEQDNYAPADRKPGYGDTHSNSAYFDRGFIYYVAGDGNGAVKLALSADGKSVQQVWRNQAIDNFMGGFVLAGHSIYTSGFTRKILQSVSTETGMATDSLKCGNGSLVMAGNQLYYYTDKGVLNLVSIAGGRLHLVSSFRITSGAREHFSHPVIDRGTLYLRHGNTLLAYRIAK